MNEFEIIKTLLNEKTVKILKTESFEEIFYLLLLPVGIGIIITILINLILISSSIVVSLEIKIIFGTSLYLFSNYISLNYIKIISKKINQQNILIEFLIKYYFKLQSEKENFFNPIKMKFKKGIKKTLLSKSEKILKSYENMLLAVYNEYKKINLEKDKALLFLSLGISLIPLFFWFSIQEIQYFVATLILLHFIYVYIHVKRLNILEKRNVFFIITESETYIAIKMEKKENNIIIVFNEIISLNKPLLSEVSITIPNDQIIEIKKYML